MLRYKNLLYPILTAAALMGLNAANAQSNLCGSFWFDAGGPTATSPSYLWDPFGEDSVATFCPNNPGDNVHLQFNYVDIPAAPAPYGVEGCFSYLEFFDGPDTNATFMGVYCGEESGSGEMPYVPESELHVGDVISSTNGCLTVRSSWALFSRPDWEAAVICGPAYACSPAEVSLQTNRNCDGLEYTVTLTVTEPSDASVPNGLSVIAVANGSELGQGTVANTAGASVTLGPFPMDVETAVTIAVDGSFCPTVHRVMESSVGCTVNLTCGQPYVNTYCYGPNETQSFSYHSPAGEPITVYFVEGGLDAGETLMVYDGPDNASPLIVSATGSPNESLTGQSVQSSGGDLYMVLTTNDYRSCSEGYVRPWTLSVGCGELYIPGCTDPEAFNYNPDANVDNGSCQYRPANDEPCGAVPLTCNGGPVTSDWVNASTSPEIQNDNCPDDPWGAGTSGDVWFSFVADGSSTYSVWVTDGPEVIVALYRDNGSGCGDLQLVGACQEWQPGYSDVFLPGTYYLTVRLHDDFYNPKDSFQVNLTCQSNPPIEIGCTDPQALNYVPTATEDDGSCIYPPANDEPCGATVITCNGPWVEGTLQHATNTMLDGCYGPEIGDVWFRFESDGNSVYEFKSKNQNPLQATYFIMSMFAGDDCSGNLTEIIPCMEHYSMSLAPPVGTYYVRIRKKVSYSATLYKFKLLCTPIPTNDNPCAAIPITCEDTHVTGSNVGMPEHPKCGGFEGGAGVWYSYTAETNGTLRLDACQPESGTTNFNNDISVFTGTCSDLTCYAYDGYNPGSFNCQYRADLTIDVEAGETYFILMSGSSSSNQGVFDIAVTCTPEVQDCPGLGNIGDTCDDGDPFTENDVVTANCTCAGTPVPCPAPLPPVTGMAVQFQPNGVNGTWNPIPEAVLCQHRLKRMSDGVVIKQFLQPQPSADILMPLHLFAPNTAYRWAMRCGCSTNPVLAGPWNSLTFITPGGPKISASPNPVAKESTVWFSVANAENALLEVYDLNGRSLATLYAGRALPDGKYSFTYDASALPRGTYVYKLTTDSGTSVTKFLVAR